MNLSVGIVGLPNVGKSTLFNALLKKQQALAANYPFATIEPNVGVVAVPDARLQKLAEVVAKEENPSTSSGPGGMPQLPPIKPATVEFLDIAGLVKGASEGAGLGNKFLSHIREVSVIAHVVRAFTDEDVTREGSIDPKSDYETIKTELLLADLQSAQNQESRIKSNDPLKPILQKIIAELNKSIPVRDMQFGNEEKEQVMNLFFLTSKPELIVLNVAEEDYQQERLEPIISQYTSIFGIDKTGAVVICAKIESELASLSEEEQIEYLKELGLQQSGLERLIQKAYEKLGLISFLTAGKIEVRAWTLPRGSTAVRASGEIHTDFMKKFIKAEIVSFDDYVAIGGRKKAREQGRARLEGRDYVVNDGDVIEFKIGS
ncbi:MAG: redox-regulated ATPase YchF [Candidatus Levybacteria bacterium]|nr:redox-regulated ATPase YchF [Candidatus Levybacteria bacterium]